MKYEVRPIETENGRRFQVLRDGSCPVSCLYSDKRKAEKFAQRLSNDSNVQEGK